MISYQLFFNMRRLTHAEKLDILRLAKNRSTYETATEFNRIHPNREHPLSQSTVSRILLQIERTGTVSPQKKSYPNSFSNAPGNIERVKAYFTHNPHASSRDAGYFFGTSHSTILKILHQTEFFPYKLRVHQQIHDEDLDTRVFFCRQLLDRIRIDRNFLKTNLWTDESPYRMNGGFNRQNRR